MRDPVFADKLSLNPILSITGCNVAIQISDHGFLLLLDHDTISKANIPEGKAAIFTSPNPGGSSSNMANSRYNLDFDEIEFLGKGKVEE
jgi:hypothetical protein